MKKIIAIILSILLVMAMTLQVAALSSVAVKGIKLDKSKITLNVGQTYKLKVTLTPAKTTQKLLTYVTGNKKIATIDKTGKITGIGAGTTAITVYTPNKKVFAKCIVTITKAMLKPVELTWYIRGPGQPADTLLVENEMNRQLKDRINATLKLFVIPWGEYVEKMNVIIAAGEKFDLCYSSSSKGFYSLAAKGAYADLTQLLPKYAPEFMNSMPSYLFDAMKVKGKLLAVPNLQGLAMPVKIAVNGNYYNKYKDKLPAKINTLNDLDPFMSAIKDGEKNVVPFTIYATGATTLYAYYELVKEQFPVGDGYSPGIKVADKAKKAKIINQYESDAFKEYVKWTRKAYQNGWFEKGAATGQWDQAAIDAGKYAMWFQMAGPQAEATVYPNFKVVYLDIGCRPFVTTAQITATMTSINYNSPNPDRAMMFLNLMNTDVKLYNTLQLGIAGKHYVLKSDGHWDFPAGVTADNTGYNLSPANWELGNTFNGYPQVGVDASVFKAQQQFDKNSLSEPGMGFVFDSEPVKTELAQVTSVLEEILVPLVAGTVDPDEYYPQLLEKLKTAGSDKIIAEKQKQLDAFLAYSK